MATSGSISASHSYITATLSWSQVSQDVANNRTTISYTLSLKRDYAISSSAAKSYSIVINGSTVASGTTTIGGTGTKTIKTGTAVIPHGANGDKSFAYSFAQQLDINYNGQVGTLKANGTSTLNTIARASVPTLSKKSLNYGESLTINTNRASTGFTHTVKCNLVDGTYKTLATGVGPSYTWVVPLTAMSRIPNATSISATVIVETYSGNTLIGSKSIAFTAVVPASVVPSFSTIGNSELTKGVKESVGAYVKGISQLSLSISGVTEVYGSKIKSYSITFDGKTWATSTATTSILANSGTRTITAKITDGRGRSASKSITISVLDYAPPKITTLGTTRANSNGAVNEFGTYAKITRAGTTTSLTVGGVQKNVLKYTIRTKLRTATTWTTNVAETTHSSLSLTGTNTLGTFDVTKSYDVRVEIADLFNRTIAMGVISTGDVTMSWGRSGIGIGKVWEKGALDVDGITNVNGAVNTTGAITTQISGGNMIRLISTAAIGYIQVGVDANDATGELKLSKVSTGKFAKFTVDANTSQFNGNMLINSSSQVLTIQSAGTNSHAYIGFNGKGAGGGRSGYVGVASNASSNVSLIAEQGDLVLSSTTGKVSVTSSIVSTGVAQSNGITLNSGYFKMNSYSSSYGTGSTNLFYDSNNSRISLGGAGLYNNGHMILESATGEIQLKTASVLVRMYSNSFRVRNAADTAYNSVLASAFTVNSKRQDKKNIEEYSCPLGHTALEKIMSTPVRKYHYKTELDIEVKHTGLILDEVPMELIDVTGEGIDIYAMASILWKGNQELNSEVKSLKKELQEMQRTIELLASKIN